MRKATKVVPTMRARPHRPWSRRRARAEHRREQRPNSSATESVPSRHRRQGTGGAAAAHLNIDASNAQTSRQYLPRAMYIPYGTYIIHDTYDSKYRICLFTLKSNRHLHYMQVGHARPRGDGVGALVATTARLPSAPLSRVPASLATLHETVCFAARKQTVSLIQVTN